MIQRTLFSAAVCFFCFSAFSNAQELTPQDIDQSILYGAPQDPSYLEEDKTYMDQIIVNRDWAATTGCLDVLDARTWNGTQGGQCANSGPDKSTFTFGYGQTVLAQTQDAINDALKIAGVSVVGYRWQWKVKNADTNYEDTNGARGQDPLYIRVIVKDNGGNVLDEQEWDYSYHIDGWEQKYGMHWYDPFISGEDIDTITTEIEAKDAGFWAGWYGPEVGEVAIYSIFVYEAPETQDCSDPLLDPTCPGYAEALSAQQDEMLALINNSSDTGINTGDDAAFVAEVTITVEESVMDSPVEEVIAESTSIEESPVLEEVADLSNPIEEPAEVTVGELESEQASNSPSVNPLAVAQNAVSQALSEAQSNVENTLDSTAQSVTQAEVFSQNNEQQLQQLSESQSLQTQQLSNNIQQSNNQQNESQQNESEQSSGQTAMAQGGITSTSTTGLDLIVSLSSTENQQEINNMSQLDNLDSTIIGDNQLVIEVTVDSFEIAALNLAIDEVFQAALNRSLIAPEEFEEEEQESFEDQNAKEDELVEKALSGDDSEDAQAALLGYNPEFRAYQTPQLPDSQFYQPKEIYGEQQNYDNPNQRFFNGASDTLHKEMVRQQYNK